LQNSLKPAVAQVPVGTELAVGYTVSPESFKVPVVSPGQSGSFKVPAGGNYTYNSRTALQPNVHPQPMGP
jgi:hypothetical protein